MYEKASTHQEREKEKHTHKREREDKSRLLLSRQKYNCAKNGNVARRRKKKRKKKIKRKRKRRTTKQKIHQEEEVVDQKRGWRMMRGEDDEMDKCVKETRKFLVYVEIAREKD